MFMPSKRQPMKLSPDEELFLRHWMYDEVHYLDGPGLAKQLQLRHSAVPADLAVLIAAAIPDAAEQAAAGNSPPPAPCPRWPWHDDMLSDRVREARALLSPRHSASVTSR
jgi:hypothetical protein